MRFALAILISLVSVSAQAARIELTAPTLFYISTSGSDANDGLTTSTPKLTTNAMLAVLQRDYDFKCYDVQILHAASATAYAPVSVNGSFAGQCGRPIRLVGSTTRGAVTVNGLGGDAFSVSGRDANVLIEGFSVQAGAACLHAWMGGTLFYRDMEFLNASYHVSSEKLATTFFLSTRSNGAKSNYFITGSSSSHLYVNGNATAYLTETVNSNGLEFIGTGVGFSVFANVIMGGNLTAHTNSFIGTINNYPSLWVQWNSVGGYETQLPGNDTLNVVDASSMKIH